MSRNHAQIVQHQQGYVIEDLGSQNKLRVQGRLTDRNLLRNGWQLLIGGVEFTFYDGSVTPGGSA
jgi:pSer/pThr/pTyr-binding forkhead associated (FHA) protein